MTCHNEKLLFFSFLLKYFKPLYEVNIYFHLYTVLFRLPYSWELLGAPSIFTGAPSKFPKCRKYAYGIFDYKYQ